MSADVDWSLEERRARRRVEPAAHVVASTASGLDDLTDAITAARAASPDGRLPWLAESLAMSGVHPSLIGRLVLDHVTANLADAVVNTPTWSTR